MRSCGLRDVLLLISASYVVVVFGCGRAENRHEEPPPPGVTVARPLQKTVTSYLEETGTTEAVEKTEVRARVKGFLNEVSVEPGSLVKEGAVLFRIAPELYEAKVASAQQFPARCL